MHLATCYCENGKYLASIMDDSAIMRDVMKLQTWKLSQTKKKQKQILMGIMQTAKCKIFIFYLHFY